MIVDPNIPATIRGVSSLNPIPLYAPDKPTFNQKKIKLVPAKKYFQAFDFNSYLYNRLDILFDGNRIAPWDINTIYNTGDKVAFIDTGTSPTSWSIWISNSDDNLGNNPNPFNTDVPHTSPVWNYAANNLPADSNPLIYDIGATYTIGDRVIAYTGSGTFYRVFQSLTSGNTGNQPRFTTGVNWDHVTESLGTDVRLKIILPVSADPYLSENEYQTGDQVTYGYETYESLIDANIDNLPPDSVTAWVMVSNNEVQFADVRPGSKHQFVNWLWSGYSDVANKTIKVAVYDVPSNTTLAISDCINILVDNPYPSVEIKYSNSDDFNGIAFENANQEFYIRIDATFFEETHPVDSEDYNLASGIIVSLRKQMVTKRLLDIIEPMPVFMHKLLELIFMCDYNEIDGVPYKKQGDEYQRAQVDLSLLSTAKVLLTQADSVLVNISKGDILSGSGVFSGEFSDVFPGGV